MGDVAEMMQDGTMCAACGGYIGEPTGSPRYCSNECRPTKAPAKVACPVCRKNVKLHGLPDHMRDVHEVFEAHAAGRKAERERIVGIVRSLMERFGHAKAAMFVLTDLERQIMEATDG